MPILGMLNSEFWFVRKEITACFINSVSSQHILLFRHLEISSSSHTYGTSVIITSLNCIFTLPTQTH